MRQKTNTTKYMHINLEYHSVGPVVGTGIPPAPSPAGECASPRNQRGEGRGTYSTECEAMRLYTSCEGVGSPDSDDWRESLVLRLLCD
jgi:hypothetical protein